MALRRRLEVDSDVIDLLAIGNRDQDVLVHLSFGLIDVLDLRIGDLGQFVHTAFETLQRCLSDLLTQFLTFAAREGLFIERHLDSESLHDVELQALVVTRLTRLIEDSLSGLVDHIGDIHTYTLTHQGVATFGVDEVTLLVHDVVVFDQSFTNTEVVLLHFLLRPLDRAGDHGVLDHLALLEAHSVHDAGYTLGAEHTHQVVLQRDIEDRRSRVTLTSGTSAQLTVHTTALMALRTDDSETSGFLHLRRQLDIGTTTRHVGCYRHNARSARFGNDLRLLLVQLGVEDIMLDLTDIEHLAQQLGYLDGSSTDEHRTALVHHIHDLVDHGIVFLALGAINTVVHVNSGDGFVGRDDHYVQFVNIPELTCFGLCRTGHTCEFMVHTEIVLQSDRSESLGRAFYLDVLLGFHRLVESVGPPATLHNTSGLLIHDLHLAAVDDIVHIFLEKGVCFEQLVHGMHALGLNGIIGQDVVLLLLFLLG